MGGEFGMWEEWNSEKSLPWDEADRFPHRGIRRFVRDLNGVYRREPPLYELDYDPSGFRWIDCNDNENSVFSLLRRSRDGLDLLVAVVNFTPMPREGYRIGVPEAGVYLEILNSDSVAYEGSNVGNSGAVESEAVAAHGHAQSLRLTLPPLGALYLKWQR